MILLIVGFGGLALAPILVRLNWTEAAVIVGIVGVSALSYLIFISVAGDENVGDCVDDTIQVRGEDC